MNLENLRNEVDEIDNELIFLLNKRFELTDKIGDLKKTTNQNILDKTREEQILTKINKLSNEKNIENIKEIYINIMNISKQRQK